MIAESYGALPQNKRLFKGAAADCIPIISMTLDDQGRVCHINSAWERILGYSLEETRSKALSQFMPADSVYRITGADFPQGNELVKFEFPLLTKSQDIRWFSYYAHNGTGDTISGYLIDTSSAQMVFALDHVITFAIEQLTQAEQSIRRVRDELTMEVFGARQSYFINNLNDEVERLRKVKVTLSESKGSSASK